MRSKDLPRSLRHRKAGTKLDPAWSRQGSRLDSARDHKSISCSASRLNIPRTGAFFSQRQAAVAIPIELKRGNLLTLTHVI
jgi:hypothetical protein